MKKWTHIAKIYGVRCYYNVHTSEAEGTNWLNKVLLDFFVWLDCKVFFINQEFKIELIEEL